MLRAVLCLAVGVLTACSSLSVENTDYKWYKKYQEAYPMVLKKEVSQDQVMKFCKEFSTIACAVRLDDMKKCVVLTSYEKLPEWALKHEKAHCDGYSHDGKGSSYLTHEEVISSITLARK